MVAYIAEIERLKVMVASCIEQDQNSHNLTVGHHTPTVTATLDGGVRRMLFQLVCKIFAKLFKNTENLY